jgi:hypothetical protein
MRQGGLYGLFVAKNLYRISLIRCKPIFQWTWPEQALKKMHSVPYIQSPTEKQYQISFTILGIIKAWLSGPGFLLEHPPASNLPLKVTQNQPVRLDQVFRPWNTSFWLI